jgi:hypothetical protein
MDELFAMDELIMMSVVLFASFWIFLFNYRQDNKEKYEGHSIVFTNIQELAPFATYRYPVGFLFGLTSNVSIPIVLKWFQQQITKKLNAAGKGK